jgi:alanine racemase
MEPAAVAEIRSNALQHNLQLIRRHTRPGLPVCAAVKADAYGHGIRQVLPVLAREGVERVAVAHLDEALHARSLGWSRPILCFGAPLADGPERELVLRAREAIAAGIACTISSVDEARLLSIQARRQNRGARVEIKIDTGMGRMGLPASAAAETVLAIAGVPGILIDGVYTHFATADERDPSFAREQLTCFQALIQQLEGVGGKHPPCHFRYHAANSAAIFRLADAHLDQVRPGLAIYGYWGGEPADRPPELRPVLRVVSRLVAVRRLPAGHAVGYGCTFRTSRESVIGVVPLGYADGYRRLLDKGGLMRLAPVRERSEATVPVIGRISMDQTSVDLTGVPDVRIGDPVVVVSDDPAAPNSVESLARSLGTIPYEVTCLLGQRIKRVLV